MQVDAARETLSTLLALAFHGQCDLRFADETAFSLEPNVPYGWSVRGQQHGIPSRKGGRVNVFGLLNYAGDLTSFTTGGTVDSAQVIEWLSSFAATITGPTVVVLDNAPWHRSKLVVAQLAGWRKLGLELFYLPPYCPHLNIIETLWRKMKYEWLRPRDYDDTDALHTRIHEILSGYGGSLFNIKFNLDAMFV